jgi:hypothetical protein
MMQLLSMAQPLPEVSAQGVAPDGLDGSVGSVGEVVLASAGGFSKIEPVGGLVAGSSEHVRIDESLEPIDGMGIYVLPVSAEGASRPGEEMGGQAMRFDPGKHEKAGVVGQKMNVLAPSLDIPPDIAVPAPDMPWSRRKGKAGKRPSVSQCQVFEVLSDGPCVAQVVELCEQSVMKPLKRSASDLENGYGSEGGNIGVDRILIYCDGLRGHRMSATC